MSGGRERGESVSWEGECEWRGCEWGEESVSGERECELGERER